MSVSKGIVHAIQQSLDNNLYTTQVFIGNPQGTALSKITDEDKRCIKEIIKTNAFHLQVHNKYIYNFGKNYDPSEWHIKTILKELKLADDIGALTGIIHMGKAVGLEKQIAIDNFVKSIKYICNYLKNNDLKIKLGLETSCGSGTELFYKIEDFAHMFNLFTVDEKKHLNVVIDTCHSFVAGHDLVNDSDKFIKYIKKHIGIKYIGLIHLTIVKLNLGGKVDRHAKISQGFIGEVALVKIAKFAANNNIDIILETPTAGSSFEDTMNECKNMLKLIQK